MPDLTIVQAVNLALEEEMARDEKVFLIGEDIGTNGGVFRATQGLAQKYGEERVLDTPLNESGIIGFGIGLALYGLRPVVEVQFADFIWPGMDQVHSEAAKYRYRSGSQFTVPLVIRAPYGGGVRGAHYHSQSPEAYFTHTPGLKVVIPSNPYDTKGLLTAAIRDPDPVLFFEPKRIYRAFREEVPNGDYTVPLGKANIAREGADLTILSYGAMLHISLEGAQLAEEKGISCEVLDLRTLMPLDIETIEKSVKKTGRVISVTEAPRTTGFGAELSALVAERWIEYLEGPILRVAGYDTPFPFILEHDYLPTGGRVLDAVNRVYNF
ncbi:MAG: alpha-ketoacid dehydrogenase subunit beta [Candidatus Hodarchaeales archaeon]|jgi:2-oxoisovalerate dehydrogenase E1 component beta subunit